MISSVRYPLLVTTLATVACADTVAAPPIQPELPRLDVTHGQLERGASSWKLSSPAVRAVAVGSAGNTATLRFTYDGPTSERATLASGGVHEQVGLKLRARDSCNVLYVMWRASESSIIVQLKRNEGARTHKDCGNQGYRRISGQREARVPRLQPGASHSLTAAITDETLAVSIDGSVVWRGALPAEARALMGPAGFRTDNVRGRVVFLSNK